MFRLCTLPLFGLIAGSLATAQLPSAASYSFKGEPFSASAAELTATSSATPADQRFAAQILFEQGIYKVALDGTLLYQHHLIYRVDSQAGVEGWSEISADWDPWYEKPAQLRARVLKTDGHFIELDQKTITDAPVKADDSETFSSGHVRRAPLPGVAIGSIVEEMETTEERTPYFKGGSLYSFPFLSNVPVGRERVTVEVPIPLSFKDAIHDLPGLTVERTETNGTRRVVYEATTLPARHSSDIDLPSNDPHLPLVEFATGESWGKVAAAYAALSDPQTITEDAKTILPADLPSEREGRIRTIVERLHHEVRYTGVEFGAAKLTPQRPAEVIKRHYGDCKDKATLLVAMLRSAGIPADLALLSTGPGRRLNPDLPGMNRFDHAIVYVPPAGTDNPVWIDATAQYSEVGTLPYEDQGRSALVIAPEKTGLSETPVAVPGDSTLVETRMYTLAELGPAKVVEDSQTHGYLDANYRANYGGADTPKVHEDLENYVKQAYLGKTLVSIKHGDGTHLSEPFHLTLQVEGARRGLTSMTEALVAIFPNATANGLPEWFSTSPPVLAPDASSEARENFALSQKNRLPTYELKPFRYEQRSKIIIPVGFTLRSLPTNKVTPIGPASLTETYSTEAGTVTADFRFDSGPSTLTTQQALALRADMLELNKREYVGIYFDQIGAKELAAGHIREALEADRTSIGARPQDALPHVRLAMALLQVGIGDEAHSEARLAAKLDPTSAKAFSTLGWTLEHDDLGERFGKGYDLPGAIEAYRMAIKLDPLDNDQRFDLAILYEFDAHGIRYSRDADMSAAIASYRELIERNKDTDVQATNQYRENLLYALLNARQFIALDKMLATMPTSSPHTVLAITSASAQHGAKAGIARAQLGNVPAGERNQDLRSSGAQLAQLHLYAEAADAMSAGMQGGEDAPTVARQIEMYRSLTASSIAPLPATNPTSPVQAMTIGLMGGTLNREQMQAALSHEGYSTDAAYQHDIDKTLASSGFLKLVAAKSNIEEPVLLDLIGGNIKFASTGDDNTGYSVVMTIPGAEPSHFYVVRDSGAYRILGDEHDDVSIGNAVLLALTRNNLPWAKAMLDWKRDLTHKAGGDDPFSGPIFPRFWTVGSEKKDADSPEAIRLAAYSLMAESLAIKPYLPEIAAAREKASGQRQTDLDLLLAQSAIGAEEPKTALPATTRLLEQEPDSATALRLAGSVFLYEKDAAGFQAMLAPRLAKRPKDRDLLTEQVRAYELAQDFSAAQATEQKVLDSGKAEAIDYNSFAWLGLFTNHLGDKEVKSAQQSNMLSKNASFADLHTMACVYAAQGRTTEARQTLKDAMYAASQAEPNSEVWFALGLIYEQYGENAAALTAYHRVKAHEEDNRTFIDPVATYTLAQRRLTALQTK